MGADTMKDKFFFNSSFTTGVDQWVTRFLGFRSSPWSHLSSLSFTRIIGMSFLPVSQQVFKFGIDFLRKHDLENYNLVTLSAGIAVKYALTSKTQASAGI